MWPLEPSRTVIESDALERNLTAAAVWPVAWMPVCWSTRNRRRVRAPVPPLQQGRGKKSRPVGLGARATQEVGGRHRSSLVHELVALALVYVDDWHGVQVPLPVRQEEVEEHDAVGGGGVRQDAREVQLRRGEEAPRSHNGDEEAETKSGRGTQRGQHASARKIRDRDGQPTWQLLV